MLSSDLEFTHFLKWTETGQVLAERFVPTPETLRLARYDAETAEWLKVLRNPPPAPAVKPPPVPIPILKYRAIEHHHTTTKTRLLNHQAKEAS